MKVNGHTSFFLNVEEGKLFPNKDFDASVQKIDLTKVNVSISILEIANKQFLYASVQPDVSNYSATFNGGKDFNQMDWKSIQSSQSYYNMQLCHGYDKENFPFVIANDDN